MKRFRCEDWVKLSQLPALPSAPMAGSLTVSGREAARFDELQRRLVPLWQSIQAHDAGRADDRGRPLADARGPGLAEHRAPGLRGAVPVPAPAPPPAAGAARVRHVAGDQPEHRRLLPRPAARRDPFARPAAAVPGLAARRLVAPSVGEAARAAPAPRAHPRPDRRPQPRASRPLQHDRAGARPRARARHPHVRRRPAVLPLRHQDGLPAAVRGGGRAASARRGGVWRGIGDVVAALRGSGPSGRRWSTRSSS